MTPRPTDPPRTPPHTGGNVNNQDDLGATPLHLAVRANNPVEPDVVRVLLRGGAQPDIVDHNGQHALAHYPSPQVQVASLRIFGLRLFCAY